MKTATNNTRNSMGLIPWSEIEALGRRIRRRFKPIWIILFGSYAWGHPDAGSDVDLLVVLPTRRHASDVAGSIAHAVRGSFPLDIIVRTPHEVQWRLAEKESFLTDIFEKGKVLYEARHARVGQKGRGRLPGGRARVSDRRA